jgi:hypothetical protein
MKNALKIAVYYICIVHSEIRMFTLYTLVSLVAYTLLQLPSYTLGRMCMPNRAT